MNKLLPLIVAAVSVQAAEGQVTSGHHWAQLLVTASGAIDLDTATIQRVDGLRRIWLRWDLDRSTHEFLAARYQLEHREVDCSRGLTRVLAVETHDVSTPVTPRPEDGVSPSDSVWHPSSAGSLADMVVKSVCRWRQAGA